MSEPSTINTKLLNNLVTQILTATQQGITLDIHDPDQVGQFVFAVLGLGAGLIPGVGSSLGALCNLLGAVFFTSNQTEDIWNALRERIENLIDSKIAADRLLVLQAKIAGFQQNWAFYTTSLKDLEDASPEQRPNAASTVKAVHIGFRLVLQASIPEFQIDAYAVASLPLFTLAASMYLALLSDGVKHGADWTYSDTNITSMRAEFVSLTSSSNSGLATSMSSQDMQHALQTVSETGAPETLLASWREAHTQVFGAEAVGGLQGNWPSYVNNVYLRGRQSVHVPDGDGYPGYPDARQARTFSQYDTNMILNCLNYATLWPFLLGDPWTADATQTFDREIFYGPYSRWADNAPWNNSNPPPTGPRGGPITAINVRAWDDIDGVQIQNSGQWGPFIGNSGGGASRVMSLAADEYVTTVSVSSGFKLGRLSFTTNKGNNLSNGNARHADRNVEPQPVTIAPPGYGLTSVRITRWVGATPTGCEGVILGFRPLLTNPQLASQ